MMARRPDKPARPPSCPSSGRPDADRSPGSGPESTGGDALLKKLICPICGSMMVGLHCKLICENCGYREDCSDLF